MRRIDWESPLSDEDVAWLRQAGFMSEEQIQKHQEQFGENVAEPEVEEDTSTQSALDPLGKTRGVPVEGGDPPIDVTPDPEAGDDEADDDYDQWKVRELQDEVVARNEMAATEENVTSVEVEGTGKKTDLINALRKWDDENPGVLEAQNNKA
jgi:hypothetical protein